MKRLNVLPGKYSFRLIAIRPVELGRRTQEAFLACAAAIALISIVSFLEKRRIIDAEETYRLAQTHYIDIQHREARLQTVIQTIHTLGTLSHTIESVHRQSAQRLAFVARIGEDVPSGVWLTAISGSTGVIEVQGRAQDTAAIGSALRQVESDRNFREARFLHAGRHGDAGSGYIDFSFTATPQEVQ
jgi:Tfp pilus assembly protein PilN